MIGNASLIAELDGVMASRRDPRRHDTLRKVTDLFVASAPSYSEEQVAVFDNVIGRLAVDTDVAAKAELAERLAPIENAPPNTVRRLADDDAIDVAGPVLAQSKRLNEAHLIDLAATRGQRHMLAIANRRPLGERVTDALLTRRDQQVARTVATNASAQVSERGYATLVGLAEGDPSLAECVAARQDIPPRHLRTLIAIAPEPVQRRLAASNPRLAERIRQAIAEAELEKEAAPRDFSRAGEAVKALADAGALGDEQVQEFVRTGRYEESVAALAELAGLPIKLTDRLLSVEPINTLLIVAKAAGLSWPTAKDLLSMRGAGRTVSPPDIENVKQNFFRLKAETAKQGVQLYKARAKQS
jgi:uncharacterized protein (DUF2336 family)